MTDTTTAKVQIYSCDRREIKAIDEAHEIVYTPPR